MLSIVRVMAQVINCLPFLVSELRGIKLDFYPPCFDPSRI